MSMRWFKMINLFIVLQVFLKHFSDTFPSFAPKKRAKRIRKFSTCVDMLFVWQYLHRRTMTCVNRLWSKSNSYSSRRTFFTVWPLNTSRHKLIASQLYMREIYGFLWFVWTCESIRLSTFRQSVHTFWFCKLASIFLTRNSRLVGAFGAR